MIKVVIPTVSLIDGPTISAVLRSHSINSRGNFTRYRNFYDDSIIVEQHWQDSFLLYRKFDTGWEIPWVKRRKLLQKTF